MKMIQRVLPRKRRGMSGRTGVVTLMAVTYLSGAGCEKAASRSPETGAQLFENMGDYQRQFTTDSPESQKFLNQAMIWLQAFNHDEAIRSFKEAARLDKQCAVALWGVAFAEGPNYNDPVIDEARSQRAWEALQEAVQLIDQASPVERALIEALQARYTMPAPEDRTELNQAYADAMAKVWEAHPKDPEVGMLYAEAMMVCKPWELYDSNREPAQGTAEIEQVLEEVLKMAPDLPGANHLYIHAVEMSKTPGRAVAVEAAERLGKLVPASGHLRHMPAHIFTRIAEWNRAIELSQAAMKMDRNYLELSPDQGIQIGYIVHDSHILAYSAMMVGREKEAMAAAREMWELVPKEMMKNLVPFIDHWMCSVYDVQKRFGRWNDLLDEPPPPAFMPYTTAMWHAHRAIAYAAKAGEESDAEKQAELFQLARTEQQAYRRVRETFPNEAIPVGDTPERVQDRLAVIEHFIPGEIALQQGDLEHAIEHLRKSVEAEDLLSYGGEPPEYLQPVRHTLGAVYLKAERFDEAEAVFRRDLAEFPGNGWSLYGLQQALAAQGRDEEASEVGALFDKAWAKADEPIGSPCKCIREL